MLRISIPRRQAGSSLSSTLSQCTRRGFTSAIRRSQQQPPRPREKPENTTFKEGMSAYRPFGAPFLKVFLGAIFTYQVIYYVWMKLETSEKKLLKNEEIRGLEKEAKQLAANAKS
ncbi:hypothetical protein EYB26_007664 [Talaromyces marneffei]|nr:uncharacterized protein EYB26_007664 [Talaromyces marneffei]QGA19966.1 hypothetical protein EYB26_007664 [Talaromyces marneffei]